LETFAAASSREAADSGRLTDDWKVVFGYSARIRVKFRASQLYQAMAIPHMSFRWNLRSLKSCSTTTRWSASASGS
jgi:hypothetical protein